MKDKIARHAPRTPSVGEYLLAKSQHKANPDACPKCDGFGAVVEDSFLGNTDSVKGRVVPCPCRIVTPRRFRFLSEGLAKLYYCDFTKEYEAGGWPNSPEVFFAATGRKATAVFRQWLKKEWVKLV